MIRTRFAPSPTGHLHIGGARTALFSWLHARQQGGRFILRIEDTDRERSTQAAIDAILEAMDWLRLDYDEGPYYQTQRFDRYREVVRQLLDRDQAYHCYCSRERLEALRADQLARKEKPRYDGRCRERSAPEPGVEPVVRFRNPLAGEVVIDDLIRGRITIRNSELDDLIIQRSDGTPTYNFCVVVDDLDMAITHVIRGDDHVNNTPRQINIFRALEAEPPRFGHVPMILGADGARLSKRHGAVSVLQYRDEGYLPEALLNYLVRLGWSHGDEEVFDRETMLRHFSLAEVNRAASTFNPDKLLWLNQHYIKQADSGRLGELLAAQYRRLGIEFESGAPPAAVAEAYRERARTLDEMARVSTFLYREFEDYDTAAARKQLTPQAVPVLERLREALAGLDDWQAGPIHLELQGVAEALGVKFGKVGPPLRVAVTGGAGSPSLDTTLELLGQERTLARIDRALSYIERTAEAENG
ncbi:MAG: glutamate--tRNA ligase [Candidatus Competibacterales bacterium]|nr:glutamate--tRNA ligase [Candidatus Competibacterales bacterium]